MTWKLLSTLAALPIIAACAADGPPAQVPTAPRDDAPQPSLAVASVLGDDINVQTTGLTIFHNDLFRIDVAEWTLGARTEDAVDSMLEENGYQTVTLPDELKPSLRLNSDPGLLERLGTIRINASPQDLQHIGRETGADQLVLIVPHAMSDSFFRTSEHVHGVGVYQRHYSSFTGPAYKAVEQATLSVRRYDLATGERMDQASCSVADERDARKWLNQPEDLTPQWRDELAGEIHDVMRTCIGLALYDLDLIRSKPRHVRYDSSKVGGVKADHTMDIEVIRIPKDRESMSRMSIGCSKPYDFSQDCSTWSTATRELDLNGNRLEAMASEEGDAIYVETPGWAEDKITLYRGTRILLDMLQEAAIEVQTVTPVVSLGVQHGYLIETNGDGYSILKSRASASQ